jgi:predicted DNA-binding protein
MPGELKALVNMIARARGKQASSWIREVIEAKVQEEVDMARTLLSSPLLRDGITIRSRPDIDPD